MFASLIQFIRVKTRLRAVLVGAAAVATVALASGWALAGFGPGHGTTGGASLSSARLGSEESTVAGNGPQGAAQQSSAGTNLTGVALGPDGRTKHSPKRADPGHHKSAKTTCPSGGVPSPGSTINGGLAVDGDCTVHKVTINGGLVITGTGHLTLYGSTVNGGTVVQRNGEFDSDFPPAVGGGNNLNGGVSEDHAFDMDIFHSTVQGSVHYIGGPLGVGFAFEICGSRLGGDITLENVGSGGAEIGDVNLAACAIDTITGSVHIRNNPGIAVEFEKVTIGGSVEIMTSKPSLTGNTIGGSLLCHNGATLGLYDPDDSNTGNKIHGTNTCT